MRGGIVLDLGQRPGDPAPGVLDRAVDGRAVRLLQRYFMSQIASAIGAESGSSGGIPYLVAGRGRHLKVSGGDSPVNLAGGDGAPMLGAWDSFIC
jgi:hypothetical protein